MGYSVGPDVEKLEKIKNVGIVWMGYIRERARIVPPDLPTDGLRGLSAMGGATHNLIGFPCDSIQLRLLVGCTA